MRPSHPLRLRAIQMMRDGLATPGEIAQAGAINAELVRNWRQRAGIQTDEARVEHVRRLLLRPPRVVPVIDDPDAAPF